jgi:heat shock protein HslJ
MGLVLRRRGWPDVLAAAAWLCPALGWPQAGSAALAGTHHWRLERIVSMDDAQPPRSPAPGAVYEVRFGLDRQAALQLDCNRAHGGFEAERTRADADAGGLRFGPLASTRALCGTGSLEPLLMRQLPYVRSWIVRDGRLHMSLMADGGILEWRPVRSPR